MHALTSLYALIRSSFMTHERATDAHGTFFKVAVKYKGQKPILFERIESELVTHESSQGDSESP